MADVSASVFFCEDYRVDQQGLPLLIGLMPPAAELLVEKDRMTIFVVTVITAPPDIQTVEAELEVNFENVLGDDATDRRYSKKFERPDEASAQIDWMSVAALELGDLEFTVGSRIRATFTGETFARSVSFTTTEHQIAGSEAGAV